MPRAAAQVFQAAEEALRAGKFVEAAQAYLAVVRGVPTYLRARFRIADVALNFRARAAALEVYKACAWHAIRAGQPLQGLVALKMAALLDPSQNDVIEILAELYARDSERLVRGAEAGAARGLTAADKVDDQLPAASPELIEMAAREAASTEGIAQYPNKLPAIPLFSFLDADAFARVLTDMQLRRFVKGQKIIEEGQVGDSFFILAEGAVSVTRDAGGKTVNLARLSPGAVFGEMALISRAPRTATVTCDEDCEVLELKRAQLEQQAQQLASVTQALREFTQERFLANLTATSAVFKPFPRSIRAEIVKKFIDFPVDPSDELIAEGEAGQGLFLVMKGSIEVSKKDGSGSKIALATLKEGDVFGEISLLTDQPTTATCTAVARGQLLFLPKKEFVSTMARHPELKDELAKLTADRLRKTKDLMSPENYVLVEDDDLIML